MVNMTIRERALLDTLARAIGDLERLRSDAYAAGWHALAERAAVASARARAVLVAWPMSEAPAEAQPDPVAQARNAGAL